VKVKICGITNLEDAVAAVAAGCDALGFVFFKKSPRYIPPEKARAIIAELPAGMLKVGIFVNPKEESARRIARFCKLDLLQFHGQESAQFCRRFKGYKIIKAFRVRDKIDLKKILKYQTFAYLFDTLVRSKPGGTGKKFDWGLLRYLKEIKQPIFLSGGLNAQNVKRAIQAGRPDWVDVSSSLEVRPGKKDRSKIRKFMRVINENSA